jgi:hypothetical protein
MQQNVMQRGTPPSGQLATQGRRQGARRCRAASSPRSGAAARSAARVYRGGAPFGSAQLLRGQEAFRANAGGSGARTGSRLGTAVPSVSLPVAPIAGAPASTPSLPLRHEAPRTGTARSNGSLRHHSPAPRPALTAPKPLSPASGGGGGGLDDGEELDVAVFRFTLGIPGFDDRLIPRFVGGAAAALLAVNHILSAQPVPEAQVQAAGRGARAAGAGHARAESDLWARRRGACGWALRAPEAPAPARSPPLSPAQTRTQRFAPSSCARSSSHCAC